MCILCPICKTKIDVDDAILSQHEDVEIRCRLCEEVLHVNVEGGVSTGLGEPSVLAEDFEAIEPSQSPSSASRVLIAHDSYSVCVRGKKILEDEGFRVQIAHDSRGIMNAIRSNYSPKLVFIDVALPGRPGKLLCRDLKRMDGTIVVVLIAGVYDRVRFQRGSDDFGVDAFIDPNNISTELALCAGRFASPVLAGSSEVDPLRNLGEVQAQPDEKVSSGTPDEPFDNMDVISRFLDEPSVSVVGLDQVDDKLRKLVEDDAHIEKEDIDHEEGRRILRDALSEEHSFGESPLVTEEGSEFLLEEESEEEVLKLSDLANPDMEIPSDEILSSDRAEVGVPDGAMMEQDALNDYHTTETLNEVSGSMEVEIPMREEVEADDPSQKNSEVELDSVPFEGDTDRPSGEVLSDGSIARVLSPAADSQRDLTELSAELREAHEKAQRLARIIVSDIVLYNQESIDEAVQENRFYEIFKGDIKDGRDFFEERVPEEVRRENDYLHDRLEGLIAAKRKELGLS